ncbi:MAG: S1C family serine protease, partial [Candidatus Binatia bacterium]
MLKRGARILVLLVVSIGLVGIGFSARHWLELRGDEIARALPSFAENGERARTAPSFADVAAAANPAVVNVSGIRRASLLPPDGRLRGAPGEEGNSMNLFRPPADVPVLRKRVQASGFAIRDDGTIVTSRGAVAEAGEVAVRFQSDPHRYKAEVIASDAPTDVAVLRVADRPKVPVLAFGEAEKTRVGDWVLAVGNPFGLNQTVTAGIVSARDAAVGPAFDDFLQVNALINPGDAGGPLLNLDGEVVGINGAALRNAGAAAGIAFALSSDSAKRVIEQLETRGKVVRGWLGVSVQAISEDLAGSLGLADPVGALVADVVPGGPAANAGLQRGDVIVAYRGEAVTSPTELPRRVAATDVEREVEIRV